MIEIWHNPRCSKSRQTLALIEASGSEVEIREYLKDAPDEAEIAAVLGKLNIGPIDLVRKGEKVFKELDLKNADNQALIVAMASHPILIERPIAIKGERAVIGRPPENVEALL